MTYAVHNRHLVASRHPGGQNVGWRIASSASACAAVVLAGMLVTLRGNVPDFVLLGAALIVLLLIALLHGRFLHLVRSRLFSVTRSLEVREREFRSVFDSTLDAILILDDQMVCQEANTSALEFFAVSRPHLVGRSVSLFESGRAELSKAWRKLLAGDQHRGKVEMVRADGARVAAEFVATANMLPGRHLIVLRDATERVQTQEVRVRSVSVARSAFREAQALRCATLALTQTRRLNPALDTLLETLRSLIPYESAQVLLLESPTRLFLAREVSGETGRGPHCPETLDSAEFPALRRALARRDGLLIGDTRLEADWRDFQKGDYLRSWLGVPLCAGDQVTGLLSVMHSKPEHFTAEHLRFAGSLAIPATAAIENARLYERAEICSAELEKRVADIRRMEQALQKLKEP